MIFVVCYCMFYFVQFAYHLRRLVVRLARLAVIFLVVLLVCLCRSSKLLACIAVLLRVFVFVGCDFAANAIVIIAALPRGAVIGTPYGVFLGMTFNRPLCGLSTSLPTLSRRIATAVAWSFAMPCA